MKLPLKNWLGIAPGIDPKRLPDGMAQTAQNVNLDGNTLDVTYEPSLVAALPDNLRKNIYKYKYTYFTLVCGVSGTTSALQAITAGTLTVPIKGVSYSLTALNFSGNSKAEMAAEIQVKLRTATSGYETVVHDAASDKFIFGSTVGSFGYLTGTLSGATLLNGATGGTAVTSTATSTPEWLSWVEENINIVKSPAIEDIYRRIYWTGETGGKLRMKGLFGTRDVGVPVPAAAPTVATAVIEAPAFSCAFHTVDPTTTTNTPMDCPISSAVRTATGWNVTFSFPGLAGETGMSSILFYFSVNFYGITGKVVADVGTKFPQTYSGNLWASPEMTSLVYSVSGATGTGSAPNIVASWSARTITMELDMHYTNPTNVECYYAYRYVTDLLEQGEGSPVTAKVIRSGDEKNTITVTGNADTTTIKKIKIYRTATGTEARTDNMYELTEINNPGATTATYVDLSADTDLTEAYSSRKAPPDHLKFLVSHPAGFLAAAIGNLVYVCDLFLPHSWTANPYPAEHEVMGLAVSGNDIEILTKGYPYLLSGNNPAALRMTKLMVNQACASSRSVCNVGNLVAYASPDGEVVIEGGQADIVTDTKDLKLFQRSNWQGYTPSSMIAGTLNGKLYAFMTGISLVFKFGDGLKSATTTNDTVSGLFCDLEDDTLYVIQNGVSTGDIYSLNTSATAKQIIYKSREIPFPRPVAWSVIKVTAASYPTTATPVDQRITVRLYANNVQVAELFITSGSARRLPIMRKEENWAVEVLSYVKITEVAIADNMPELGSK